MSDNPGAIPVSSQTVGPYFRIGLDYLMNRAPVLTPNMPGMMEIRGRVIDRDGVPVPDAMLEFWSHIAAADYDRIDESHIEFPPGFSRAATDSSGEYSSVMPRPALQRLGEDNVRAPHLLVLVFARGLLRHLISRVYLADEQANESDEVLTRVPIERRATLIAQPDRSRAGSYRWDVILQGAGETVFFAW